jgi:hypothetical protein
MSRQPSISSVFVKLPEDFAHPEKAGDWSPTSPFHGMPAGYMMEIRPKNAEKFTIESVRAACLAKGIKLG